MSCLKPFKQIEMVLGKLPDNCYQFGIKREFCDRLGRRAALCVADREVRNCDRQVCAWAAVHRFDVGNIVGPRDPFGSPFSPSMVGNPLIPTSKYHVKPRCCSGHKSGVALGKLSGGVGTMEQFRGLPDLFQASGVPPVPHSLSAAALNSPTKLARNSGLRLPIARLLAVVPITPGL